MRWAILMMTVMAGMAQAQLTPAEQRARLEELNRRAEEKATDENVKLRQRVQELQTQLTAVADEGDRLRRQVSQQQQTIERLEAAAKERFEPDSTPAAESGSAKAPATRPAAEGKQAARKRIIQTLLEEGVFQKIEVPGGTIPRVWIRPASSFFVLDLEVKEKFLSVVAAYYYPDGDKIGAYTVKLYDTQTGKHLGDYSFGRLKLK